jgi:hypothetical protein
LAAYFSLTANPRRGEARQDVAEVAGVEIELASKLGHRNVIAMSQPEQHPGLGKT